MIVSSLLLAISASSASLSHAQAQEVTFTYKGAGTKVQIAGDMLGWDSPGLMTKVGDKQWIYRFKVADKIARFEYKFIVDGQWINDPSAPKVDNGFGSENSVFQTSQYKLSVPDETPKSPLIRSEFEVKGRKVIVYAPKKSAGLPILCYADGQDYEGRAKIQNIYANLVAQGKLRPAVLVLVPPRDRMKEYWGDWKQYGELLLDGILPEVRKRTQCSSLPGDLYLGGSSLGGRISLKLAQEFPQKVAGGVHSQSGAFQVEPAMASSTSMAKLAKSTRVVLDYGTYERELTETNDRLSTQEKRNRRVWVYKTGEGHNWTAWRNRMVKGLLFLLGK